MEDHVTVLRSLLAQPVCPFHEEAVAGRVAAWAARRGVDLAADAAGNVVLRYRRGVGRCAARWVFTAHMDHPGFVTTRRCARNVWAEFRGGVRREFFVGSRVRLFAPGGQAVGTVRSVRRDRTTGWWTCRLELGAAADVPPGTVGMWDLPSWRLRGRRLSARCCDDVAGTAAVVCAIDELARRGAAADVIGLLTRAEEAGFVGAMAACRLGTVPRGALVVGIEASKAQPFAPLGGGAVIRVGDRASIFDPQLTEHLAAVAADLSRRRRSLRFTRQLMAGGTCESTVYCLHGHRAAALALPLGNYHNMGSGNRIRPEQIHLDDFTSLVALLVALATERRTPADTQGLLLARLDDLYARRQRFLKEHAP